VRALPVGNDELAAGSGPGSLPLSRPSSPGASGGAASLGSALPSDEAAHSAPALAAAPEALEADTPAFNPLPGMHQLLRHCQAQGLVPESGAIASLADSAARTGVAVPSGRGWFTAIEEACEARDRARSGLITSAAFADAMRDVMPRLQAGSEFSLVAGLGLQGARRVDYRDFCFAMGRLVDATAAQQV